MRKLSVARLAVGVLCTGIVGWQAFAADDKRGTPIPDLTSIDRPWVVIEGQDYLPPASSIGPVTYDHAHPVMVRNPNNAGAAVDALLRIADVSKPNLVFRSSCCMPAASRASTRFRRRRRS
jgi:hypothetical protein